MSTVKVTSLYKQYGKFAAVYDFNLDIEEGELVVFLGPSGCGKTTTLRMIAGFVEPTSGSIFLDSRPITKVPSYDRNIGVVFQSYALFPHLDVYENVAFGLRRRRLSQEKISSKVDEALAVVQMGHLKDRRPKELSGGQQQRVAIARAVAIDPALLLLDEPLSNLDARLRLDVRQEIRSLQKSLGITTILVTHDQEEAMSIADRLVVMRDGGIQQVGSPQEVYSRPVNRFVAEFIGSANCLSGRVAGDGATFVTDAGLALRTAGLREDCKEVVIRPEAVSIETDGSAASDNSLDVTIRNVTYLGSNALLEVVESSGVVFNIQVTAKPSEGWLAALRDGQNLTVGIDRKAVYGI